MMKFAISLSGGIQKKNKPAIQLPGHEIKQASWQTQNIPKLPSGYDIASSPWKDNHHAIKFGKPSMSMGHGLTMANCECHNQRLSVFRAFFPHGLHSESSRPGRVFRGTVNVRWRLMM